MSAPCRQHTCQYQRRVTAVMGFRHPSPCQFPLCFDIAPPPPREGQGIFLSSCVLVNPVPAMNTTHWEASPFLNLTLSLWAGMSGVGDNGWDNLILPWRFWVRPGKKGLYPLSHLTSNNRHSDTTILKSGDLRTECSHGRISRGTLGPPCAQLLS